MLQARGMTLEEFRRRYPERRDPISPRLFGKWVAWDYTGKRIHAHADTRDELIAETQRLGIEKPVFQQMTCRDRGFGPGNSDGVSHVRS